MSRSLVESLSPAGLDYAPEDVLAALGIPVVRVWLRDTFGAWSADRRKVVLAENLSPVQERCVLAHELEHVLAGHISCGPGPLAARQERLADREAARKLVAISDLGAVAQQAPALPDAAAALRVTERMLKVRLDDLDGEGWPWPATSKTGG